MADYSGATSGNITLNDGDTIGATNNLTISPGDIASVTAGAEISVYTGRYVSIEGTFNAIGTEVAPVIFSAQAADPDYNEWTAIRIRSNGVVSTFTYVIFRSVQYALYISDYPGATLSWSKIRIEDSQYAMYINANVSAASWAFTNWHLARMSMGTNWDTNAQTNTVTFTNWWLDTVSYFGNVTSVGTIFSKIVWLAGEGRNYIYTDSDVTFSQWYTNGQKLANNAMIAGNYAGGKATVLDCVFFNQQANYSYLRTANATAQIDSSYNDFVSGAGVACDGTTGTLNSDHDYYAGNALRPIDLVDTVTGTQYTALNSHTNAMAAPNHPLSVDNISVGTPEANAVTITYDCAAGTSGKRLYGLPYIKYGTTSGVYTGQSFLPIPDKFGLYWIGWYTDKEWKQTGHSVALSNLKAGTKYYYKCCFVDPLGRLAESAEGDFTTASEGGAGRPFPPFFH